MHESLISKLLRCLPSRFTLTDLSNLSSELVDMGQSWPATDIAMELSAVLSPMRVLDRPCRVTIISDSKYVVDGINGWMIKWHANNWRKSDGGPIKNEALWREMYYFSQHHLLQAVWVKGHSGNFSNAVCDQFACIGAYNAAGAAIPPHLIDINRL